MNNKETYEILQCAYEVHSELGPGLFEGIYEICLQKELLQRGFKVERQKTIPVIYKGESLEHNYRIDLLVNDKIILELKSVCELNGVHFAQILSYLKLADLELGYLINFNVSSLKQGIRRVINTTMK